jgi:hypothetical protein
VRQAAALDWPYGNHFYRTSAYFRLQVAAANTITPADFEQGRIAFRGVTGQWNHLQNLSATGLVRHAYSLAATRRSGEHRGKSIEVEMILFLFHPVSPLAGRQVSFDNGRPVGIFHQRASKFGKLGSIS